MIEYQTLGDLLLGRTVRDKLQQGWSPQCERHPAADDRWGVLKTTAIQAGAFSSNENKELPSELVPRPALEVRQGDLLLTCAGPRSRCGVPALVRSTQARRMISGKMYQFRPSAAIDPRYLEAYLLSPGAQKLIDAMKTGISDSGLNLTKDRFLGLPVPVVPVREQLQIVDILEDHLSRLDAADAYATAAARGLGRASAAQLTQLVSDSDPTARLGALATSSGYGTSTKCAPDGAGPAVVRIPNIKRGAIDLGDEKRVVDSLVNVAGLMLSEGDLLIVRTNGSRDLIGRTAVVQGGIHASFASYLIRYRFDPDLVLAEWVHQMLARPAARTVLEGLAASSAGQYNLSLGKLDRVEIAVPPLTEQARRLSAHRETTYSADRTAASVEAVQTRSKKLRRALLAAAFSGRLTGQPSDLEIAEEMARA